MLLFLIRVAEWPPVWERAVHSVYRGVFRERLPISVCSSFPLGFESEMWNLIILIPFYLPPLSETIEFVILYRFVFYLSANCLIRFVLNTVAFRSFPFPTRCLGWDLELNWVSFWGFSTLLFSIPNSNVSSRSSLKLTQIFQFAFRHLDFEREN